VTGVQTCALPILLKSKPWLPYVVPFGIYMAFLLAQTNANLLWLYPVKTVAVAAALIYFRKEYEELWSPMICVVRGRETGAQQEETGAQQAPPTPNPSEGGESPGSAAYNYVWAVAIGLAAIAIWIAIDPFYPKPAPAAPFDPATIGSTGTRSLFLAFRVVGAVIVVPLMEELFWRAFLIRWLVNENFKGVAVGTFTWASFAISVALFGSVHNEWLAGLICGALYNWLYYKRKDMFACVVAHAVSNAALAAWVLTRGQWNFW
jgi:CAAX prenyl protease-like protein